MITLGPPLKSREPTRLRSAMSKNLQEFAYRCCSLCPFLAEGRSHPSARSRIFLSPLLRFPSFSYVCVCMCLCLLPPRDLSPTNLRQRVFLCGSSPCLIFRWMSRPTRARPAVSSGRPIFCLFTCR